MPSDEKVEGADAAGQQTRKPGHDGGKDGKGTTTTATASCGTCRLAAVCLSSGKHEVAKRLWRCRRCRRLRFRKKAVEVNCELGDVMHSGGVCWECHSDKWMTDLMAF